jgi:hypothetical protein
LVLATLWEYGDLPVQELVSHTATRLRNDAAASQANGEAESGPTHTESARRPLGDGHACARRCSPSCSRRRDLPQLQRDVRLLAEARGCRLGVSSVDRRARRRARGDWPSVTRRRIVRWPACLRRLHAAGSR